MLKRIIGVITVKDNWAVQSIGFRKYLPLGRPEVLAENYDRWQLDEIFVVDIGRTKLGLGPNFELVEKITSKKLMTPLCYMGGIRNSNDALHLISKGADRVALDSLFRKEPDMAYQIADAIGRQAIIRVQPFIKKDTKFMCYDYNSRSSDGILCPKYFAESSLSRTIF